MKLSLNWLKSYIDPKLTTEALVERLVMAGWDVEALERVGKDIVLQLEITPNRPDCLSILGLAREIGAMTGKKVNFPRSRTYKSTNDIPITIEDRKDCSRYIGTLIKDVTVADSSQEIKERLSSIGIRPVNNAVDVTNFVLMETGQPLHAFDYDQLIGGKIVVRRAKSGEKITTIDGIERTLDPSMLVIADAQRPVAMAGLMGGKDTQVTLSTKNILLESAHFDMTLIRQASRKLGLRSESSYRFERSVDWRGVLTGANRATDLLLELTKGQLAGRTDKAYLSKGSPLPLKITADEVERLLGIKVPTSRIKSILTALECKVSGQGSSLTVTPPSFRGDLKERVDFIEEVARTMGYDRLPARLPHIKAKNLAGGARPAQIKRIIRETLKASGVDEAVTLSMTNTRALARCLQQNLQSVKVFNPLTIDQELMRPSFLPHFMAMMTANFNRGQKDLRLFEIAKRYTPRGEKDALALLLTGSRYRDWRLPHKSQVEFFDVKGILENIFYALKADVCFDASAEPFLDATSSSSLNLNGQRIGVAGKLHRTVLENWDIKYQDVYFAEVNLEPLLAVSSATTRFEPLGEFPTVTRDVSLAVKKEISYKAIQDLCRQYGGDILREVKFIEQYTGEKVSAGQKALVFSLIYQSRQRTLREEEVNSAHERILQAIVQQLGAIRR